MLSVMSWLDDGWMDAGRESRNDEKRTDGAGGAGEKAADWIGPVNVWLSRGKGAAGLQGLQAAVARINAEEALHSCVTRVTCVTS